MSEPTIEARGLSKRYRLGQRPPLHQRAAHAAARLLTRQPTPDPWLWSLRDASFTVAPGEVLGVVGANGAGKSTLLKLLARIAEPTAGHATIRGRVASLLEVGTGFHPELTGRENAFLNAAVLGMTRRDLRRHLPDIVEFSGVEKFLDTPVKHYSSGMRVRLAFAVAAHLRPEVLIVDEVLAVGDAEFQRRCLGAMHDLANARGRTVLFVSHHAKAIQSLCDRVLWLDRGRVAGLGPTDDVLPRYLATTHPTTRAADLPARLAALPDDPDFRLLHAAITQHGRDTTDLDADHPFDVALTYRVKRPVAGLRVYFDLRDEYDDILVRSFHDEHAERPALATPGAYTARAAFPAGILAPRPYTLVLHAGVFNVRDCTAGGVRVPITAHTRTPLNLAYPQDPVRSKLQPRIAWSHHPKEAPCSPLSNAA